MKELYAPFDLLDVKWRIGHSNSDKTSSQCLAYIDSRIVQARLDEVLGCHNWSTKITKHGDKSSVAALGINVQGEWIWKEDVGIESNVMAEKGEASDAIKRAAVLWGVFRYAYGIKAPWVRTQPTNNGKSATITQEGYDALDKYYLDYIQRVEPLIGKAVSSRYLDAPDRAPESGYDPQDIIMFGKPKPAFDLLAAQSVLDVSLLLVPGGKDGDPTSLTAAASNCFRAAGFGDGFVSRVCKERDLKWTEPDVAKWLWERACTILDTEIKAYIEAGGDPEADWIDHAKQVAQLADETGSAEVLISDASLPLFERQP